jgi:FK506-binding protein 4/5
VEQRNFEKESRDNLHKMMGCSRDHAAELDIYNRSYPEKIKRIQMMKEEGNKAFQAYAKIQPTSPDDQTKQKEWLDKASYYYAQALLIFYYLIPDTEEQEKESDALKLSCHLNQSLCFLKMKRYSDCLSELDFILSANRGLDQTNVKALYRKC